MKKIIMTAGLAAIMSASAVPIVNAEPFNGMYVGADIGTQKFKYKKTNVSPVNTKGKLGILTGGTFGMSTVAANGVFMAADIALRANFTSKGTYFAPGLTTKLGYRVHERVILTAVAGMHYNTYKIRNSNGTTNKKSRLCFTPGLEALLAIDDKNIVGLGYQHSIKKRINFTDPILGTARTYASGHGFSLIYRRKI